MTRHNNPRTALYSARMRSRGPDHIDASATCPNCHATVARWVAAGVDPHNRAIDRAATLRADWLACHPCIQTPNNVVNAIRRQTLPNRKKAA